MTNAKYLNTNSELEWGKISKEDIFRKIYKHKSLEEMTDKEVDRMLEDLI